jgi:hypothetical protein
MHGTFGTILAVRPFLTCISFRALSYHEKALQVLCVSALPIVIIEYCPFKDLYSKEGE